MRIVLGLTGYHKDYGLDRDRWLETSSLRADRQAEKDWKANTPNSPEYARHWRLYQKKFEGHIPHYYHQGYNEKWDDLNKTSGEEKPRGVGGPIRSSD